MEVRRGIDLETKFDFIQKVNFCYTTLIISYHSTVLMMNPKLQRSSFSLRKTYLCFLHHPNQIGGHLQNLIRLGISLQLWNHLQLLTNLHKWHLLLFLKDLEENYCKTNHCFALQVSQIPPSPFVLDHPRLTRDSYCLNHHKVHCACSRAPILFQRWQ